MSAASVDYEEVARRYGISIEMFPLHRSQRLNALRWAQEQSHRDKTHHYSARKTWMACPYHVPYDPNSVSGLRIEDADEFCNRTAPIFVLCANSYPESGPLRAIPGFHLRPDFDILDNSYQESSAFLNHLHYYIYNRWFLPHKSEIDCGQFLTKVHLPRPRSLPSDPC